MNNLSCIVQDELFMYSRYVLLDLNKNRNFLELRIINIQNNQLYVEGKDNFILNRENYFFFCKLNGKVYEPDYYNFSGYDLIAIYDNFYKGRNVVFNIQLENLEYQILYFFMSYKNKEIEIKPSLGLFTHIPGVINGYYNSGEYILKFIEGRLIIYQYKQNIKNYFEKQYCKELLKRNKKNIINLRKNYFKSQKENKNNKLETWIINDKQNLARDNGEYFF